MAADAKSEHHDIGDPGSPRLKDVAPTTRASADVPVPVAPRIVVDIGSPYMLKASSVRDWFDRFSQYGRRTPTEVCLPAVGWGGPFFDSSVQPAPAYLGSSNPLRRWVSDAREALGEGGTIWGKIVVNGEFLNTNHVFLKNQFGMSLGQVCVVNPIAQDVFGVMTGELLEHGVDGVVIDFTDAYPNSGASGLVDIGVHCFCDSCRKAMRLHGFDLDPEVFSGPDSPMRLVLKAGTDGTSHIDPPISMIKTRDASGLVALAQARRFIEATDEDAVRAAQKVIAYCDARATINADAVRALTRPATEKGKRSAVILGSVDFDQSQQVTLDHLSRGPACDEVWVSDASEEHAGGLPLLCYLGSRSTYYLNAFFELLETANSFIGGLGVERFLERLLSSSKRISTSNELSPAAVFTCLRSPQYHGVVGVPMFEREHRRLVDDLTTDVTGQVLPESVLQQFRIAAGPAALAEATD